MLLYLVCFSKNNSRQDHWLRNVTDNWAHKSFVHQHHNRITKKKEHYYAEKEKEAQLKLYFQCLPLISLTTRLIFPCDWSVKGKHADGGGYTGSPLHHMPVGHKHLNVTRKLKHFPITLALNLNLLFHKLYKVGDKVSKFLLNRRWMLTFEGRS